MDFPGGSVVKNLPANAGDVGSIPGPGRSLGEEKGYPVDRGAWWAPWGRKRVRHNLATKPK